MGHGRCSTALLYQIRLSSSPQAFPWDQQLFMSANKSCNLKDLVHEGFHGFFCTLCDLNERLIIRCTFPFSHHGQTPSTGLVFVNYLGVETFHLLFFIRIHLKSATIHPCRNSVEHVVVTLLPADGLVIRWVFNNMWFVFLDHANSIMKLLCFLCVEHIEALFTNEFILDVGVLLVQVVG